MRLSVNVLVAVLALLSHTGQCQDGYDDMADDPEESGEENHEQPPSSSVKELTTLDDFEAFLDDKDASVIGAFTTKQMADPSAVKPDGWDDDEDGEWYAPTVENPQYASFKTIAAQNFGYRFACTFSEEVLHKLKQKSSVGLYIYRAPKFLSPEHGDRARERFPSDKLTESAVSNWLAAKTQPLVGEFSSTTKDRYKSPTLIIFMNLDFEQNAKGVKYVLKRARKAAVGLKGRLAVAVASLADMNYELEEFGLTSNKHTSDVLMAIRSDATYDSKNYGAVEGTKFTADALQAFANDYLEGRLVAHIRPDPPPPPPYDEDGSDGDEGAEGDEGDESDEGDEGSRTSEVGEEPKDEM